MTSRTQARFGFSIFESAVAIALGGLTLLALSSLHQLTAQKVAEQQETQAANISLQERLDQIRALSWVSILDPAPTRALLANTTTLPQSTSQLREAAETISVQTLNPLGLPLPTVLPSPDGWTLQRSAAGQVSGSSAAIGATALSVQITASLTWQTQSGRTRTRALTTLVTLKLLPL